jgi:hypothetical protein
MLPVGFETVIPTSERTQTHVSDRTATETGPVVLLSGNVTAHCPVCYSDFETKYCDALHDVSLVDIGIRSRRRPHRLERTGSR